MDVLASAIRGGVSSLHGSYVISRRTFLETVYVIKEFFFKYYDITIEIATCKRRKQLQPHLTTTFHYDSPGERARRTPRVPLYDFTELQHGVKSREPGGERVLRSRWDPRGPHPEPPPKAGDGSVNRVPLAEVVGRRQQESL
mmetsp:Transcript_94156/g.177065  ORF Transcript_94156/g.177065 Transcript_94156/m.177065 type:complete len:142 (+) Transcript_94156:77-502(+)